NFFMMSLSRGGQNIWMSVEDAEAVGIEDNDWIEAVNRNGVVAARAVVSHRMPKGTAFMYHAQERTVNTPISETSGQRGGVHNSLTRIMIKPTHLVGGYANLSFARSEEHTSELQSRFDLVCRLLLEKKKTHNINKKHK